MEIKRLPIGQYDDRDNNLWTVDLEVGGQQPVVILKRATGPIERFNLSRFLSIAAGCSDFLISALELGDTDYTLGASKVNAIAQQAIGRLSRLDGHYEIHWIPNDPSLPF